MELTTSENFNLHEGTDQAVAEKTVETVKNEVLKEVKLEDVQAHLEASIKLVEDYYKFSHKKEAYDCLVMAERTAACLD